MKKFYVLISCISVLSIGCSKQTSDSEARANEANQRILENRNAEKNAAFAVSATESSIMEVETGRIALQKTANPDIKEFAQRMIDEHTKTTDELKKMAATKKIELPVYINQDNQDKIKDLSNKSEVDFDNSYIDLMVNNHQNDLELFQKASDDLEDPELKTFAKNQTQTLASHLDMARRIQDKINKPVMLK
jgi:putative membrane protein